MLVDAGNARLKWALHDAGGIGEVRFASYRDHPEQAVAALCDSAADAAAIAVSNVAGRDFARLLHAHLLPKFDGPVWFAHSSRLAGGVRNAYVDCENLGVDRWSALVGAYSRMKSRGVSVPVCVVDAGTAITIDALRADGNHLGGLILPGLTLQHEALLGSTADIAENATARSSSKSVRGIFATDTGSAIAQSAAFACAAAIDRCAQALTSASQQPIVMLAGGDADALVPWLATNCEICPNLVLEGLAVLFEQRSLD